MSAPAAMLPKRTREEKRKEILKVFLSAHFLTFLLFVCLSRYIWAGLIYMFVWTFLFAPNGLWPVAAITVLVTVSLVCFAWFVSQLSRVSKLRKQGIRYRPNMWSHTAWTISVFLIIPPAVALTISPRPNESLHLIKVGGKLTYTTQKQDIHYMLHSLAKHGVFTWFNSAGN